MATRHCRGRALLDAGLLVFGGLVVETAACCAKREKERERKREEERGGSEGGREGRCECSHAVVAHVFPLACDSHCILKDS